MKEIHIPADVPLTLVTTAIRPDDGGQHDRFLLDIHAPDQDLRLHFADEFILRACRRALTGMLNDSRRFAPQAVASRLYSLHIAAYQRWLVSGRW